MLEWKRSRGIPPGRRSVVALGAAAGLAPGSVAFGAPASPPSSFAGETGAALGAAHAPQVMVALVVVIVVILAMAWAARRLLRIAPRSGGPLRVLSGLSMGPREKVVLVQVGTTQLLLGVAPGRIETLHVLDETIPDEALTGGFAGHLHGAAGGMSRTWTGPLSRVLPGRRRTREREREGGSPR